MNEFLTNYGSELLVVFIVSILGYFGYKYVSKLFRDNKNKPIMRILPLTTILAIVAVIQGLNASFAASQESEMEFGLRLLSHMILTVAGIFFLHRMWKEWKEAFQSLGLLYELFTTPREQITGMFIIDTFATILIEWLQALGFTFGGIFVMFGNLWIMGKTMGEEHLLYFYWNDNMNWAQALKEMSPRFATNTVVTFLESIFIIVHGTAMYDRTLRGKKGKTPGRTSVHPQHLAQYMKKHLFPNENITQVELETALNKDMANYMINLMKLEGAYLKAVESAKIKDVLTNPPNVRIQAHKDYQDSMKILETTWNSLK